MKPPSDDSPSSAHPNRIDAILDRPTDQRRREFKYRFAQSVIFGLPVLALQWFGRSLGGSEQEAVRWVPLLQALLAGWVTYVAATGMLVEGAMILSISQRRRIGIILDASVALVALLLYSFSVVSVLGVFLRAAPLYQPLLFHWVVIVLAVWCGARWVQI